MTVHLDQLAYHSIFSAEIAENAIFEMSKRQFGLILNAIMAVFDNLELAFSV